MRRVNVEWEVRDGWIGDSVPLNMCVHVKVHRIDKKEMAENVCSILTVYGNFWTRTHSLTRCFGFGRVGFCRDWEKFWSWFLVIGKGLKGMRDEMSNRTKNSSSRQNENAWTNEASAQKISYNISTSTRNTEERKAEHDGMGRRAVKEWGFAKRVEKGKGVAKKGMKCGSGMSEINENLLCICMRMLLDCPKITHKKREAIIFAFRPRVA